MPAKAIMPQGLRVLWFESDASLDNGIVSALRAEGYDVNFAASEREAAEVMRAIVIDILVLDFDSHSREFEQVMAKWRAGRPGCCVLAIARSLEQLALASELAVDGVLMKPLDPSRVATVLNHLRSGLRVQFEEWSMEEPASSEDPVSRRGWGINE